MSSLHLLTWNLDGLHDRDLDPRTEAACLRMLLRDPAPQVVLLQEVVRRSWHAHLKHHFAAAGYVPIPADPTAVTSEYFCVTLVHHRIPILASGNDRFAGTSMGRHVVWAEIGLAEGRIWVATSHLESGKAASRERIRQLATIVDLVATRGDAAVFGGDTNLRVAEEPEVDGLDQIRDAWVDAGSPPDRRGTWPSVPLRPGQPPRQARFDRVLCRGFTAGAFDLIGETSPSIDEGSSLGPPSDHLGIAVALTLD